MSKIATTKAALYAAGYSPRNYDATYCYWVKGGKRRVQPNSKGYGLWVYEFKDLDTKFAV